MGSLRSSTCLHMAMKLMYLLMMIVLFSSVQASLNCSGDYDELEEFRELSGNILIGYLESPKASKLNGLEISQLSTFYEKYQNDWGNADCNENGVSGKSINEIMIKYKGGVGSLSFYPFIGLGFLVLVIGFLLYKRFSKKESF